MILYTNNVLIRIKQKLIPQCYDGVTVVLKTILNLHFDEFISPVLFSWVILLLYYIHIYIYIGYIYIK
jgi:hypothetical protein